ncbi:MAG: esterase-like activity of phytase family protein [Rhodobiaceae bacterium]|nr:esterase-like activity of phytase family protein [Rhodobiaceae bacterium]MCC0056899.1 esterase-like activity of phytase family protein [Rhodobiaceae bacterium]
MARFAFGVWLALFATPAFALAQGPSSIKIDAEALPALMPSAPQETRFGALRYLGGLVLTSPDRRLGGISGMTLGPDGRDLVMVTDVGDWIAGTVRYEGERPVAIDNAVIGPLLDTKGRGLAPKEEADAESVTRLPDGDLIVGLERHHRILRYGSDLREARPATIFAEAPWMTRLPENRGLEALAPLPGGNGQVVALAERALDAEGDHSGWLLEADGRTAGTFHIRRRGGFDITDAAMTADGTLFLLERYYSKPIHLEAAIRRIAPGELRPGALIDGEVLFQADRSTMIDNMEAIAVHEGANGRPVITIMSDDNFSFLQQTVMLQFELAR